MDERGRDANHSARRAAARQSLKPLWVIMMARDIDRIYFGLGPLNWQAVQHMLSMRLIVQVGDNDAGSSFKTDPVYALTPVGEYFHKKYAAPIGEAW